jgi:hypothetical protein
VPTAERSGAQRLAASLKRLRPGRQHAAAVTLLLLVGAGCAFIASLPAYETVDYAQDAGPAIDALTHLDAHRFFAGEPQMGMLSLLLRWPFAALAGLTGGGELAQYRFGAFACLFASAVIGLVLVREMHRRGRNSLGIGLVLGLWLLNPAALQAINIGHPEELLGGALCVLAVLLTARQSARAPGAALGLALATKQWALAAVPPILLGSKKPLRTGAIALAVWVPLELPLILGNYDAYSRVGKFGVAIGSPCGLWWPLLGSVPSDWIVAVARPLVLIAALAVSVVVWRLGGARRTEGQLALLALVLLLRALLDPTGNLYFALPFLMALIAFEGLRGSGLPVLSLACSVLLAITFHALRLNYAPAVTNSFYLAWAVPLALYLFVATKAGLAASEQGTEREGFEPSRQVNPAHAISSRAP